MARTAAAGAGAGGGAGAAAGAGAGAEDDGAAASGCKESLLQLARSEPTSGSERRRVSARSCGRSIAG